MDHIAIIRKIQSHTDADELKDDWEDSIDAIDEREHTPVAHAMIITHYHLHLAKLREEASSSPATTS